MGDGITYLGLDAEVCSLQKRKVLHLTLTFQGCLLPFQERRQISGLGKLEAGRESFLPRREAKPLPATATEIPQDVGCDKVRASSLEQ